MPSITVKNAKGETKVITDIAPYVARRDEIVQRLEQLYANYEHQSENALAPHEAVICELVNGYHEHCDWIDQFEVEQKRLGNIRAGYDLLKQIRGERS